MLLRLLPGLPSLHSPPLAILLGAAAAGRLAPLAQPAVACCCVCNRLQIEVAFHQRDEAGEPLRQGPAEVAAALGLTLRRAEELLRVRSCCEALL